MHATAIAQANELRDETIGDLDRLQTVALERARQATTVTDVLAALKWMQGATRELIQLASRRNARLLGIEVTTEPGGTVDDSRTRNYRY